MQNASLQRYVDIQTDQFCIYTPPITIRYANLDGVKVNVVCSNNNFGNGADPFTTYTYNATNEQTALNVYNSIMESINDPAFVSFTCDNAHKIFIRNLDIVSFSCSQSDINSVNSNCINLYYKSYDPAPALYNYAIQFASILLKSVPATQNISNDYRNLVSQFNQPPKGNKQAISKSKSTLWNDWEMVAKNKEQKCNGDKAKYVDKSTNVVTNYQIKVF